MSNVGINVRKKMVDFDAFDFQHVLHTNVESGFHFVYEAKRRGLCARGSSVLFISSVAGMLSIRTGSLNAMSKAASHQLTKSLACEWGHEGIRVNCIAPWYIDTPLAKQVLKNEKYKNAVVERTTLGRVGEPIEVAHVAVFLSSSRASYVTGQIICVDGGFSCNGFCPPLS